MQRAKDTEQSTLPPMLLALFDERLHGLEVRVFGAANPLEGHHLGGYQLCASTPSSYGIQSR